MPTRNPLSQAIDSALSMNDVIGDSFARVGNNNNPDGFVMQAYSDARQALSLALQTDNPLSASMAVTRSLRSFVRDNVRSEMESMIALGQAEARMQFGFYGVLIGDVSIDLSGEVQSAANAIEQRIISQESLIRAMILTDAEAELIAGNEEKPGQLRASDITTVTASFIASFVWDGFLSVFDFYNNNDGSIQFQKQVIAALDHRTTETCLKAHGQIREFNKKFELIGEPRYADLMDFPAFHQWCRTSIVLYNASFDGGITKRLTDSAQVILAERAAGGSGFRNPANAFAN